MDEPGEGELLTGAQLYLHLLRQNEQQLAAAERKLCEYDALVTNLRHITARSRHTILAPVAGGLAYFAAELRETNNILVLLGDGWFAERSACQAVEVAQRRIDFLRRELRVLQQEAKNLQERRELMLAEVPAAQDAMHHALGEQSTVAPDAPYQRRQEQQHERDAQDSQTTADEARGRRQAVTTSSATTMGEENRKATDQVVVAPADDDNSLATFDEQDELTEDELIAIEHELGDRVNDDEYVERILTERMIAKKERRVRAELARRAQDKGAGTTAHTPAAAPLYRTPADIAGTAVAGVAGTSPSGAAPQPSSSPTSGTASTLHAPEVNSPQVRRSASGKRVSFAPEVLAVEERRAASAAASSSPLSSSLTPHKPRSVHLGDIVEHVDDKESGSPASDAAAVTHKPPAVHATQRRSLFRQEQE